MGFPWHEKYHTTEGMFVIFVGRTRCCLWINIPYRSFIHHVLHPPHLLSTTTFNYHPMPLFDTVWRPHIVSFTSKHSQGTGQRHMHHFHFPHMDLQNMSWRFSRQHGKSSHIGNEPCLSSWAPDTDIRETKLAYHIEIEVPGVMDKKDLL